MQVMVFVLLSVVLINTFILCIQGQFEGEPCYLGQQSEAGQCLPVKKCPSAIQQIRDNLRPPICGYEGFDPIVCCLEGEPQPPEPPQPTLGPLPIPQPPPQPPQTESPFNQIQLPPGAPGVKSVQKCQEYGNIKIPTKPTLQTGVAVVGGKETSPKEFPHMAALGYGEENNIQWLCGGTLISKSFILTAAHCLVSQQYGYVQYARLGDLILHTDTDDAEPQDFKVVLTYKNPEYRPPIQYNDIALLQLDRPVKITAYVKPACLYVQHTIPLLSIPVAIGWGKIDFAGESSDHLMKVYLSFFTNEECRNAFKSASPRRLPNGIEDDTQICVGGRNASKDTCQGDSGGPLQIQDPSNPGQAYIIGITSFGKACGIQNIPGVYTRVSSYIYWIEEIVWPNV